MGKFMYEGKEYFAPDDDCDIEALIAVREYLRCGVSMVLCAGVHCDECVLKISDPDNKEIYEAWLHTNKTGGC